MEKPSNPFLSVGYGGPDYFCDRRDESAQLTRYMQNGMHVALFAIRRLGKTGLIRHVFHQYASGNKVVCIYLDILATQSLSDFTNQLATAVYNRFPAKKKYWEKGDGTDSAVPANHYI